MDLEAMAVYGSVSNTTFWSIYISTLFLNGVFRYVVGVDKDLHLKELELVMKEYIVEKNLLVV